MKKPVLVSLAVAAAMLAATAAWAGAKGIWEVNIDTVSRRVYGSLGSARHSADNIQYIGCYATAYSSGSEAVNCFAKNAAGTYVSCSSSVPQVINVARSLGDDGYLYFQYDAGGQCTYIGVENNSWHFPRIP
jgi:hypothetical protein